MSQATYLPRSLADPALVWDEDALDRRTTGMNLRVVDVGLFLTVVSLNTLSLSTTLDWGGTVTQVASVLLVIFWVVIEGFSKGTRLRFPVEAWLLLLLLGWSLSGSLVAIEPRLYQTMMRRAAKSVFAALVIMNIVASRGGMMSLMLAYSMGMWSMVGSALYTGRWEEFAAEAGERGGFLETGVGTHGDNALQAIISVIACLAAIWTSRRKMMAPFYIVTIVASVAFITKLGSRFGLVATVVLAGLFYWYHLRIVAARRPWLRIVALMGGLGAVVGALAIVAASQGVERLGQTLERGQEDIRIRLAKSGWRMVLDHPLTGVGAGQFRPQNILYMGTAQVSHNTWMDGFTFAGIPGGLVWILIWAVTAWRLRQIRRLPLSDADRSMTNFCLMLFLMLIFRQSVVSMWCNRSLLFPHAAIIGYSLSVRARYRMCR